MVVLNCADIVAVYIMWMLMTYLTDVWKLSVTHAAAIVNVYSGLVGIMQIGMAFLHINCLGTYWMLVLSSVTFSMGLSFLALSTPPVFSKVTGTCSAYEPACIGKTQSNLFYVALALTAVGKSSRAVSKDSFREENKENYSSRIGFGHFALIVVCVAAVISVAYIKPWSIRFGISAISTVVATLMFLSTSFFRPYIEPPQTTDIRSEDRATNLNTLGILRIRGVDESSSILRIIAMLMTFIVCGVVISVGNTYFLEQANHMNRKILFFNVPIELLLLYQKRAKWNNKDRTYEKLETEAPAAILASVPLLNSIWCCIIAGGVQEATWFNRQA
ncbi:hypothetical protein HHK36_022342 [Tetracentron sinense]|uniref:Uncharacterized protein n=1 Tax=Tetracentron sinense TaxID=13715 RepID=A0A834YUH3_TETSI|nr:hypothetical protein HHK36_022342 [Tetracentron sinense]